MDDTIRNEQLTVRISDFGAELQSVRGADGTEYLWQGDPAFWSNRAPNIFPYVARMTDGRCTVNGRPYEMRIHGLVKYRTLQVEEQTEARIVFRLDSDEETLAQYPFDFTYRIAYDLRGNTLAIENTVENHSAGRMYFGIGGHPGFRVPLDPGLSFEDYYLEFFGEGNPVRIGFTDDCFVSGQEVRYPLQDGRKIPLCHELFDQDAIVLKHAAREVRLASGMEGHSVTVFCPDFPYIGIWHMPHTEAPYVCIEPWSSLPSRAGIVEELSQQADLISLDAGGRYRTSWTITFGPAEQVRSKEEA